ncbi:hypothetical protein [Halobaculum sp. MBLA0143]|uniref:dual OB domain-containing protein n=1 Tax=Halobaculum sp. MBLA0143 TaxID=3079933 RepID=UPI003524E935
MELLVLASSHKYEGVCVAGVWPDESRWVRPVSNQEKGQIPEHKCLTSRGKDPEPLDRVRVFLESRSAEPHQPENWTVADRTWEMVEKGWTDTAVDCLGNVLQNGPELFGSTHRSVSSQRAREEVDSSLALVMPSEIVFVDGERNSPRVGFTLDGADYELPVTDRRWSSRINNHELDHLPPSAVVGEETELLFTISLAMEKNGSHHKLVAGVIELSPGQFRRVRESQSDR